MQPQDDIDIALLQTEIITQTIVLLLILYWASYVFSVY